MELEPQIVHTVTFRFEETKDPGSRDGWPLKKKRCEPLVCLRGLADSWQDVNRAINLRFPFPDWGVC